MADKLLAEWFWTDRWMGSSAFLLPIGPRGLYREMLTQAWRRGGRLPNDHEAIRRAVGCTIQEWNRCWPRIQGYWRIDGDAIVNDIQLEVYAEARRRDELASERGRKGAQARAQAATQASAQASAQAQPEQPPKVQPPSPSPIALSPKEQEPPADARSKHPIYKGARLIVFEWMFDDLRKLLGPHFEDFGMDEWLQELDRRVASSPVIVPQKDRGRWLEEQTLAEAKRRGLRVGSAEPGGRHVPDADETAAYLRELRAGRG